MSSEAVSVHSESMSRPLQSPQALLVITRPTKLTILSSGERHFLRLFWAVDSPGDSRSLSRHARHQAHRSCPSSFCSSHQRRAPSAAARRLCEEKGAMDNRGSCNAVHRPDVAPHILRPRAASDELRADRPRRAPGGRYPQKEGLQGLHMRFSRARNRGDAQGNGHQLALAR